MVGESTWDYFSCASRIISKLIHTLHTHLRGERERERERDEKEKKKRKEEEEEEEEKEE